MTLDTNGQAHKYAPDIPRHRGKMTMIRDRKMRHQTGKTPSVRNKQAEDRSSTRAGGMA
jgi:hypothetical protein